MEATRRYAARLYDLHIEDSVAEVGQKDTPVERGRGRLDLRAMLSTLIGIGYSGTVWFEHEKDPNDPVPGLAESVGFIRGLLRGWAVNWSQPATRRAGSPSGIQAAIGLPCASGASGHLQFRHNTFQKISLQ